MTPDRRRPAQGRGRGRAGPAERPAPEFWRAVPEPEVPDDITPVADASALVRSLGPPPLPGQAGAEAYLALVLERAAGLATALAAAADLLADEDDGDE